ncbi:ABC transporter substrate-binding protein [Geodermatophilus sp. CPCC 206100]|uniref:ABC transporter substrate-binding protein n=1 Tax=Geodermatophilus sp. CPCC 206100 TaxID=3020054 RepID=UPI003AFFAC00
MGFRSAARPVGCVTAAVVALTACGTAGGSSGAGDDEAAATAEGELTSITVGVLPNADVAPIYLGIDQGFFEDAGLDVTLQVSQGGAAVVPAVVSGEFDFGFSNFGSILVAADQGLPLQVVAPGAFSTGEVGRDVSAVVTVPGSGVESAADLAGATVATNTLGNNFVMTVGHVVDSDGGDAGQINWVEIPWPDQTAALTEGRVDAAVLVEPFLSGALEQGVTPVVWNWAETDPDFLIASYFTTEPYAQSNPDAVEAFSSAMEESLAYAQEHPDELRATIGEYTEIAPEALEKMTLSRFDGSLDLEHLQEQAELAREYGMITGEVDVRALLP